MQFTMDFTQLQERKFAIRFFVFMWETVETVEL
jgi:hypothetical protein